MMPEWDKHCEHFYDADGRCCRCGYIYIDESRWIQCSICDRKLTVKENGYGYCYTCGRHTDAMM